LALQPYLWIVVLHGIVAWLDAYGIGANDVANAFGTSVGSRTLKIWSAVCIAAVFEFTGAVTLGGAVTKTVAGSIANTKTFEGSPSIFMYGMFCAETGAMIWILLATYLELPVSTTHSISESRKGLGEGDESLRCGPGSAVGLHHGPPLCSWSSRGPCMCSACCLPMHRTIVSEPSTASRLSCGQLAHAAG
jgi:sodium-dependent phosphate transporter